MQSRLIFILIFLTTSHIILCQRVTVSGYISDATSGERMVSATVYEKNTFAGTTSNSYGFYSLHLQKGKNEVVASFIGYQPVEFVLNLSSDTVVNFLLEPLPREIGEVTVTADRRSKVESSQMSMIDIPVVNFARLPVILGEADVLKIIQLLPGVQSGTEGTTGIYVRGGGPDQNLFLLDGVPVYNANHLFGFMSVFNPEAVKSVQLYTGGFPARYGERLSSVVDIRMKEGNEKEIKGNLSVGLISSRLSIEGPVIKDRTSFIISGRRTYADLLARPLIAWNNRRNNPDYRTTGGYNFYDLNIKVNHKFSDKSRLYLSTYSGSDKAFFKEKRDYSYIIDGKRITVSERDKSGLGWGNIINALRWNYLINNKMFANLTATYSRYRFDVRSESVRKLSGSSKSHGDYFRYYSGIDDIAIKADFDYYPSPSHSVRFGTAYTRHKFSPGVSRYKFNTGYFDASVDTTFSDVMIFAGEGIAYAEDNVDISSQIKLNAGLRFSMFSVQDTSYYSLQPRLSLRYLVSDNLSFKASYSRMAQYVHLLTTSAISLPTDLWLPVTRRFHPPVADQLAVGSFLRLAGRIDVSLEIFWKTMDNLIEYKEGASFSGISDGWENKVEKGRGRAYGAELLIEKKWGSTTGWIGYTLARTDRQFENINFGRVFPAKYDRRHDVSLAITHRFNEKIDMGVVWVYGTGNAATLGVMKYPVFDVLNPWYSADYYVDNDLTDYPSRNNYRTPAYHRLDLGINFSKEKKHGIRIWNISIYNAYNHHNPFFVFWGTELHTEPDPANPGQYVIYQESVLKKISLFPIMPSLSYTFKF